MSKETVAGIKQAIEEAQRAKNLREQQEAAKRQAESLRLKAEKNAWIAQNEARLRATGVVALFEELRDSRVIQMNDAGNPATISWNFDNTQISINFDEYSYMDHGYGEVAQETTGVKTLEATISGNRLVIGKHRMSQRTKLVKLTRVVANEIIRLKG